MEHLTKAWSVRVRTSAELKKLEVTKYCVFCGARWSLAHCWSPCKDLTAMLGRENVGACWWPECVAEAERQGKLSKAIGRYLRGLFASNDEDGRACTRDLVRRESNLRGWWESHDRKWKKEEKACIWKWYGKWVSQWEMLLRKVKGECYWRYAEQFLPGEDEEREAQEAEEACPEGIGEGTEAEG